jgi:hypothetical protein
MGKILQAMTRYKPDQHAGVLPNIGIVSPSNAKEWIYKRSLGMCSMASAKSFLFFFCIAFFSINSVYAIEVDPGQDSTYCSGSTITLGGNPTASGGFPPYEYEWDAPSGISLSANDVANPTFSTAYGYGPAELTFTVKVTDSEGFTCEESVEISIVKLNTIEFSAQFLEPGGNTVTASIPDLPAGANVIWSIVDGENPADASIDDETGVITSHPTNTGVILIKAVLEGSEFDCEVTQELCVDVKPCCEVESSRQFGPILVTFGGNENITTDEQDAEGYCIYSGIEAKIDLSVLGQYNETFALENVTLGWAEKTEAGNLVYKNVTISWSDNEGIELANIADYITVKIIAASLTVNANGHLSGSLTFKSDLIQEVELMAGALFILPTMNGTFTYNFQAANSFEGTFDFSGIEDINMELRKAGQVLATLNSPLLTTDGNLENAELTLNTSVAEVQYTSNAFTIKLTDLSLNINYNIFNNTVENYNSGTVAFEVKDIEHVQGDFSFSLSYSSVGGGQFTGQGSMEDASAFGCTFEGGLSIVFTKDFELISISLVNVSAKHEKFNQSFTNVNVVVEQGALKSFTAEEVDLRYSGGIMFNFADIQFASQSQNALLLMNAKVVLPGVEMNLESFSIASSGVISVGKITANINKKPLTMTLIIEFNESEANSYFSGSFDANFLGGAQISGSVLVGVNFDGSNVFNYGHFEVSITVSGGIPIGQTGLKISGGNIEFGYNWEAQLGGTGSPSFGSVTIGIGITIADLANMASMNTSVTFVWGPTTSFILSATINVTAFAPHYVTAAMDVQYNMTQNTMAGTTGAQVKVPPSTGNALDLSGQFMFDITSNDWKFMKTPGTPMGGTIFSEVTVTVNNFDFKGKFIQNPLNTINGTINANVNYSKQWSYTYPTGFDWTTCGTAVTTGVGIPTVGAGGELNLNLSGNVNVNYNSTQLVGSAGISASASGTLYVLWPTLWCGNNSDPVSSYSVSVSGDLNLTMGATNSTLEGNIKITYSSHEIDATVNLTL